MSFNVPPETMAALVQLLQSLASADNTERAAAEKALAEEWFSQEGLQYLLVGLAVQAVSGDSDTLRSFAAVLFRRMALRPPDHVANPIARSIDAVPSAARDSIKQVLLAGFTEPQTNFVRHKIADAIAVLVKPTEISESGSTTELFVDNEWPELLPALFTAAHKTDDSSFRESAFRVFASIAGSINPGHLPAVLPVFSTAFSDPTEEVRIAAITAFVAFFQYIPKRHWKSLAPLLPQLLAGLPMLLAAGNDSALGAALEALIDLAELAPKLFRPLFTDLTTFCVSVAQNLELGSARLSAMMLLATFSDVAPQMCLDDSKYSESVFVQCVAMLTEISPDDDSASEFLAATDDETEADDEEAYATARQVLDRLALNLGSPGIVPHVHRYLPLLLQSSQWRERHAGLMLLSSVAEGARSGLLDDTEKLLSLILPCINDTHWRVQHACCNCLGQLSTDFADEIEQNHHNVILPALISRLAEGIPPKVQSHAAAALVNFAENSSAELLEPYLDNLVVSLYTLLATPHVFLQEQVLTTIAVIAGVSDRHFGKYYDGLMPLLMQFMRSAAPELVGVQAKCVECSSLIALAVGPEKSGSDCIELAKIYDEMGKNGNNDGEDIEEDDPRRPYLDQAWGRLCRLMGVNFVPYLGKVLGPVLIAAKRKQDVQIVEDAEEAEELEQEEGWDVVAVRGKHLGIHTALLDGKASAIRLLTVYAAALGEHFAPYCGEIVGDILLPGLEFYFHDTVRYCCAHAVPAVLRCVASAESGVNGGGAATMNLWRPISEKLIEAFRREPLPGLLPMYYAAFASGIEIVAQFAPQEVLTDEEITRFVACVAEMWRELREREIARAEGADEYTEEVEDEEDGEDVDRELISEVARAVRSVLKTGKPIVALKVATELLPEAARDIKNESGAITPLSQCLGLEIVAEYIENFPSGSIEAMNQICGLNGSQSLILCLRNSDLGVRQSAAELIGIVAQFGCTNSNVNSNTNTNSNSPQLQSFILSVLPVLGEIITSTTAKQPENVSASETAHAALAKIFLAMSDAVRVADSASYVALLQAWVAFLPIFIESDAAPYSYAFLTGLIESRESGKYVNESEWNAVVGSARIGIFRAVLKALSAGVIGGKIAEGVVEATKKLLSDLPAEQRMALLQECSEESKQVIQQWFS